MSKHKVLYNGKLVSRQYIWQLKRIEQGLCIICGEKAITKNHCLKHAVYQRDRNRIKNGTVKKSLSLTRRVELGWIEPTNSSINIRVNGDLLNNDLTN